MSERVEKLRRLLYQYGMFWEVGDVELYSPWPGDPDGGELRIVGALSDLLEHLSPEGLARAEELLLEGARDYGPPAQTEEQRRASEAAQQEWIEHVAPTWLGEEGPIR